MAVVAVVAAGFGSLEAIRFGSLEAVVAVVAAGFGSLEAVVAAAVDSIAKGTDVYGLNFVPCNNCANK
jgi:hypothetical protein